MRSIRSCSRARTNSQRGYALISAIVLAILYFGLVELLLMDASRELGEARRFRARVVAATLAENGAELAAANIVTRNSTNVNADDWQGTISGRMSKTAGDQFEIHATGESKGLAKSAASVRVYGRIVGNELRIQYTMHAP